MVVTFIISNTTPLYQILAYLQDIFFVLTYTMDNSLFLLKKLLCSNLMASRNIVYTLLFTSCFKSLNIISNFCIIFGITLLLNYLLSLLRITSYLIFLLIHLSITFYFIIK